MRDINFYFPYLLFEIFHVQNLNIVLYFHYKLEYLLALSSLYLFRILERQFASSRKRLLMLF
jgi:hypothetical protein